MSTQVVINAGVAQAKLDKLAGMLEKPRPLFMQIAEVLRKETLENFNEGGRPTWVPLAESTKAARLKRKKGGSVLTILQDSRLLRDSVSSDHGDDFAQVGASTPYAAIQQLGGTIERPAYSTKIRHRTDAKGNLLRRGADGKVGKTGNLLVFAKDDHKQARETWATVEAFSINIPARPYLPFKGTTQTGTLQPETERKVLDIVTAMLGDTLN